MLEFGFTNSRLGDDECILQRAAFDESDLFELENLIDKAECSGSGKFLFIDLKIGKPSILRAEIGVFIIDHEGDLKLV